jgi:hypothetical protein
MAARAEDNCPIQGSLFHPDTFFDGFAGAYLPTPGSDIPPIWNPEFFGNVMTRGRTMQRDVVRARWLAGATAGELFGSQLRQRDA